MKKQTKKQRVFMPKLKAATFAHKSTKRKKTRQAKLRAVLRDY